MEWNNCKGKYVCRFWILRCPQHSIFFGSLVPTGKSKLPSRAHQAHSIASSLAVPFLSLCASFLLIHLLFPNYIYFHLKSYLSTWMLSLLECVCTSPSSAIIHLINSCFFFETYVWGCLFSVPPSSLCSLCSPGEQYSPPPDKQWLRLVYLCNPSL